MKNLLLLCCIIFIMFSCNNSQEVKKDISKIYKPANLTIVDTLVTYYFTTTSTTKTKTEVNGNDISSDNISEMGLIYEIRKDSLKNLSITITYDKLKVHINNQDKEEDINIDNAPHSVNTVEKALSKIKGAKIYLILNNAGKVISIKGYDDIINSILNQIEIKDANTKQLVEAKLKKMLSEENVKSSIADVQKIIPGNSVYVGETWEKNSTQTEENININFKTKYTLVSLDGGIAKITAEGKVLNTGENQSMQMSIKDLAGSQKSVFEIDTASGLILSSNTEADFEGKIEVNRSVVPIKIVTNKVIKGKRLK